MSETNIGIKLGDYLLLWPKPVQAQITTWITATLQRDIEDIAVWSLKASVHAPPMMCTWQPSVRKMRVSLTFTDGAAYEEIFAL